MRRRAIGLAVTCVVWCGLAVPARAQAPQERVAAVGDAFAAVAERADADEWQQADAAFNTALDTLDVHRPVLEAEQGQAAQRAFAAVDGLLRDLDGALTAADAVRVRAIVGYIQAELLAAVPGGRVVNPPRAATDAVLAWRQAVDGILGLQAVGQFRDMRNASMDLTEDIRRRGAAVAAVLGADGAPAVDAARVWSMRLTAAALDGSAEDGEAAGRQLRLATDRLLERLGVLPTPVPTDLADVRLRFRSLDVPAAPGDSVAIPLIAEDIPQVGLGAYRVRVRWSPEALRLVDVAWDVGTGDLQRDDAAGVADLSLPPAPTGPSGTAILARLRFEVLGGAPDPRAYVPSVEVATLDQAVRTAGEALQLGDVPAAGRALSRATVAYLDGAGRPGTLYDRLDRQGLAGALATRLLTALDLTSQPAPNDVLAAVVGDLPAQVDGLLRDHLARHAPDGGVPVTFEVLEVTDTAGRPLAHQSVEPAVVRLPATPTPLAAALATIAAAGGPSPTVPPALVAAAGTEPIQGTVTPVAPGTPGTPAMPPAALLFLALAAAAVLGAAVVYWSQRQDGAADAPAGPPGDETGSDATGPPSSDQSPM